MKWIKLFIIIFSVVCSINSEEIISGKKYDMSEIEKMSLYVYTEILLDNNVLSIYKDSNNNEQWSNKLILLKNKGGQYIDAYGVSLYDSDF
jgi:hypothetical protein